MQDATFGKPPHARSYVIGLVLALVLTAIPFALVYFQLLAGQAMFFVIAAAAIIQILVHLKYFLHLDLTDTPRENLLALCLCGHSHLPHGRRQPVDHVRPSSPHDDLNISPQLSGALRRN